ncbi:valine--tRNA ligase [Candidatus Margulisiibacteriota bacterium]
MDKTYKPNTIEQSTYTWWEQEGFFTPKGSGPVFSIPIPPPNVTGVLHMGHALNMTLQDIVIRHKRLQGYRTLWLPGSDHAGIATQNVVEKQLKAEKVSRFDIGREKFVERVWEWKREYGSRITCQIRRLGASVDWSRERFTMDTGCAAAVMENFVSLYERGLIYKGTYIINWCPRCHTALSDIEVEHDQTNGHLWVIRYPFADDNQNGIIVATTRPETMFGDTAVAVHPQDKRYKKLIGQKVIIPFTNREIPIIADEHVDKDFGSGAVKVTPAHDINDYEIGQRHDLEQILIMDETAIMNQNAPEQYQGMDRFKCRKQLILDLEKEKYLLETKHHELAMGHCYRCHTIVEPYLSKQWFVSMKKLAKPAIQAVKNQQINFIPKRWEKLYFDWMESIRDWCISRQIWWGHRIPVWYCQDHPDEPIVAKEKPVVCPKCGANNLTQDEDVLDTWFSSALWPFSTLGWPEETDDFKAYFPTSLLITGYDILTFWVSRMITISLAHLKKVPFSEVYIHGLVRDASGKKMSKSLGNAVDPLHLIDEFGADALRYSLASLSTLGGQDIKFSLEKIQACRNFVNKIWNASRFILSILENYPGKIDLDNIPTQEKPANKWILSLFYSTLEKVDKCYQDYNFAQATEYLWDFTWNKFCDWYVEISKMDKESSSPVLLFILTNLLKVLHPITPFVTEEIWQKIIALKKTDLKTNSIMIANWPEAKSDLIDQNIESTFDYLIKLIREIRNMKVHLQIPPGKEIPLQLVTGDKQEVKTINENQDIICRLAKAGKVDLKSDIDKKPEKSSSSVVQNTQVYISLEGLIDIEQESKRLKDKIAKFDADLIQLNKKLSNQNFITKAPADVIAKIKDRQEKLSQEKQLLEKQLAQII